MKHSQRRTYYTVNGGGLENNGCHGWFNRSMPSTSAWSNFVRCKTYQHALRQFARTHSKHAQIDARMGGKPPRVVRARGYNP